MVDEVALFRELLHASSTVEEGVESLRDLVDLLDLEVGLAVDSVLQRL